MVLQEDSVIFIRTVRFLNAVYNDTDQKIKQICLTPGEGRVSVLSRIRIDLYIDQS